MKQKMFPRPPLPLYICSSYCLGLVGNQQIFNSPSPSKTIQIYQREADPLLTTVPPLQPSTSMLRPPV